MNEANNDASPWIVNTAAATFDEDVVDRSHQVPVVIDFWAPWCAPCRALGPVLEQLAGEYEGQFVLVKANTDELPEAAAQFNVQGIPAVYGMIDGEVIDFFAGALPEEHLRGWLERLLTAGVAAEAKRLEESAPEASEAKYRKLIEQAPREAEFKIGLARVLLAQERLNDCQAVIDELQARGFLEPEAEKVKAALDLRGMSDDRLAEHGAAAEANPDDLALQLRLAESLAGAQQFEEALEVCLTLVQKDRPGVGEQARLLMIEIFRVLPDESELTTTYRRKLSLALY